jgi:hypothetical protein
MRRSGKSTSVVWRWQARFMAEGVAGLTRATRREAPLQAAIVQKAIDWRWDRRRAQDAARGERAILSC